RRLLDDFGDLGVEAANAGVDPRRRLFDETERMDDLERHLLLLAEGKVLDRALGLRPPISVGGNFDRPEAVGFGAGVGHGSSSQSLRGLLLFFARKVHA